MKKQMYLGGILLVCGLLLVWAGILILNKERQASENPGQPLAESSPTVEQSDKVNELEVSENQSSERKKISDSVFRNLIALAIADGQLTPNEQKMLQEKATELGLDYHDYAAQIQAVLAGTAAETQMIDKEKQKGDDFEKYIVRKFDKKYFTLLEWAGDKYAAGIYAQTTLHPDLKLQFKLNDAVKVFAVECKYRSGYYKNGIEWCKGHQLNGYKKFAMETRIPVFVALGVGGTADNPEDLYILPLEKISDIFLSKEVLFPFKKFKAQERNLFFDLQTEVLK